MQTSVEHINFCGEKAVRAETSELAMVLVPGWGSNVISLRSKKKNVELLRVPATAEEFWSVPVLYGIPILFPPNRISDGTFTFKGHTYHFKVNEPEDNNHSHGLLFKEKWELIRVEQENDKLILETEFDSTKHQEIFSQLPHHFIVRMTFILKGDTLHQNATVINKDEKPFPWGLGYHTTFNFPFCQGDVLENCKFSLTADKQWELNERFLPTGKTKEIPYKKDLLKGMSLVDSSLDDVFQASRNACGKNEAILYDGNIGLKLIYQCDEQFKHWVVYNDDGKQGYLCPEPYTWVTNAPNLQHLPDELTGFRVIYPGEQVNVKNKISIKG